MSTKQPIPFSQELASWLKSSQPKTIASLSKVFGEKSFAIAFLLLLSIPALPIPTGGVTHIFELIAMLLALELIVGRKTIWLPTRWQSIELGESIKEKALPFFIGKIAWLERYSRPRLANFQSNRAIRSLHGVLLLILSVAAFLAPPFTGLDTLPALGGVLIALSIILEDVVLFFGGIIAGAIGIGLIITLGGILARSAGYWL
jgi:hypothetical protein